MKAHLLNSWQTIYVFVFPLDWCINISKTVIAPSQQFKNMYWCDFWQPQNFVFLHLNFFNWIFQSRILLKFCANKQCHAFLQSTLLVETVELYECYSWYRLSGSIHRKGSFCKEQCCFFNNLFKQIGKHSWKLCTLICRLRLIYIRREFMIFAKVGENVRIQPCPN